MKKSIKRGMGFGITSGVITTLGLIIGLYATTNSKMIILGGILTIAIADAFSDSLGIHISEESVSKNISNIWYSTFSTFFVKFFVTLIFLIPLFLFELKASIIISIFIGFSLLGIFSYKIAIEKKENPFGVIFEHFSIAFLVIVLTYFLGEFIKTYFG